MVTLPVDFVETKYPGYFWNIAEQRLYSVKVTGMLKELKLGCDGIYDAGRWYPDKRRPGYKVSVNGRKRFLSITDLKRLTYSDSYFPLYKDAKK